MEEGREILTKEEMLDMNVLFKTYGGKRKNPNPWQKEKNTMNDWKDLLPKWSSIAIWIVLLIVYLITMSVQSDWQGERL